MPVYYLRAPKPSVSGFNPDDPCTVADLVLRRLLRQIDKDFSCLDGDELAALTDYKDAHVAKLMEQNAQRIAALQEGVHQLVHELRIEAGLSTRFNLKTGYERDDN